MRRFNGICIITRDVRRLCDFYRDVLEAEPEGDETFASFTSLGAVLAFYSELGMETLAPGSTQGAGRGAYTMEFEVQDVDREYERLTRLGVTIVKPPATHPWGRRSVWFRDPDGNIVNFSAPVPAV
jgi:catechol 2,3-dioxygenase-like lactoylglutathione lyase family enzyme